MSNCTHPIEVCTGLLPDAFDMEWECLVCSAKTFYPLRAATKEQERQAKTELGVYVEDRER